MAKKQALDIPASVESPLDNGPSDQSGSGAFQPSELNQATNSEAEAQWREILRRHEEMQKNQY